MFILLIRAVTLDGAMDGLWHYVKVDWDKLKEGKTWIDGATQIFFAYSVGNYYRCEINKSSISTGSSGPFLILKTEDKEVINISDSRFLLVFIDGVLQRDGESYVINGPSITLLSLI